MGLFFLVYGGAKIISNLFLQKRIKKAEDGLIHLNFMIITQN